MWRSHDGKSGSPPECPGSGWRPLGVSGWLNVCCGRRAGLAAHGDFALPGTGATSRPFSCLPTIVFLWPHFFASFFSLCIRLGCLKFFLEWGEYKYRIPFIPVTYQFCRVKLYPPFLTPDSELIWSHKSFQTYHCNRRAARVIVISRHSQKISPFYLYDFKFRKLWRKVLSLPPVSL